MPEETGYRASPYGSPCSVTMAGFVSEQVPSASLGQEVYHLQAPSVGDFSPMPMHTGER